METHTVNDNNSNLKIRSTAPNFQPPSLPCKSEFLKSLCCQADRPATKQTSLQTFTTSLVHPASALCTQASVTCPQCRIQKTSNRTASPKFLTCCGLQEQQGEEAADQDGALHDGCQENSDSHTDYIYSGGKVKGQMGKRRRGPQRWASW